MKISNMILSIVLSLIFIFGILISDFLGYWETESIKIPQKISEGQFEDSYNPADIRGSYSFRDISKSFEVDVETLASAFNMTDIVKDSSSFKLNQLEEYYVFEEDIEIGTGSVKYFVSLYAGIPYESDDDVLPSVAVEILYEDEKISEEIYKDLREISIDISKFSVTKDAIIDETEQEPEKDEEYVIKSTTTVLEVVRWGISIEELEGLLDVGKLSEKDVIREICVDNEISFSEVKERIILSIDKSE